MPLPDPSTAGAVPWPPPQLGRILPKLQEWSAWYCGDSSELARQYGAFTHQVGPRPRPTQYSGGAVGAVARWFWGAPQAPGQPRTKLHIPVASDICSASADLLFSERVEATAPAGSEAAQERLDAILEGNGWESLLLEQAEINAALGGVYLRTTWDREAEPHPFISAVHADAAVPEFRYGRLYAVTFWQVVGRDGQRVQRLLELHEPGRIEYGLYEGTEDKLGRRIDLGGAAATRGLEVDSESGVATLIPGLTAVYIPNMRPNRSWRSDQLGAHLGRSDFSQVEPLMDAVDETFTSWMRDIRLGKGRVIVPNYMLTSTGPGQAATFNIEQEVFTGLAMPPDDGTGGDKAMTVQQFAIRTAEHADTAKALLTQIFRGAGYSAQTFGLAEEGVPTATEVHARERRSAVTREKKSRYYVDGLRRFLRALLAVDTVHFSGGAGVDVFPDIVFPAVSQPSQQEVAATVQTLRAAELLSIDTGIRMIHPDWDDTQVGEEAAKILAERPTVPDLGALPGQEGGGQLEDDGQAPDADFA